MTGAAARLAFMDDLFDPPGGDWRPVSPAYAKVKRLFVLVYWGVPTLGVALILWLVWSRWAGLAVLVIGLGLLVWRWLRAPRIVAAWGWCERGTDLCIRSGPFFRNLTIVPYGRMQSVDINSGPVERYFGLASVQLVTASPASDARIPGMPRTDAAALRDRITEIAEGADAGI